MSRALMCDRCGATAAADKGPRRIGKPVGWVTATTTLKDQESGAGSTQRHDLCPDCGAGVIEWLKETR